MQTVFPVSVVIADEWGILREGISAILRADPRFSVIGDCADGKSALELIQDQRPDVAIVDLNLPGCFALEIVSRLREQNVRTRILVMSGRRDRRAVVEALRSGAAGFILKSGSSRQLVDGIEHVVYGGVYIAPEVAPDELFVRHKKGAPTDPLDSLSAREYQVFSLLVDGVRAKEIAARLHLSPKTVDTYRASMMRKLDIHDLAGLVRFSIQRESNGHSRHEVEVDLQSVVATAV